MCFHNGPVDGVARLKWLVGSTEPHFLLIPSRGRLLDSWIIYAAKSQILASFSKVAFIFELNSTIVQQLALFNTPIGVKNREAAVSWHFYVLSTEVMGEEFWGGNTFLTVDD